MVLLQLLLWLLLEMTRGSCCLWRRWRTRIAQVGCGSGGDVVAVVAQAGVLAAAAAARPEGGAWGGEVGEGVRVGRAQGTTWKNILFYVC